MLAVEVMQGRAGATGLPVHLLGSGGNTPSFETAKENLVTPLLHSHLTTNVAGTDVPLGAKIMEQV